MSQNGKLVWHWTVLEIWGLSQLQINSNVIYITINLKLSVKL